MARSLLSPPPRFHAHTGTNHVYTRLQILRGSAILMYVRFSVLPRIGCDSLNSGWHACDIRLSRAPCACASPPNPPNPRLYACTQTVNVDPHVDRTFRGGPSDDFKLSVLTNRHPNYSSLKEQFLNKWLKPVAGLSVERIFQVQVRCRYSPRRVRCCSPCRH